MDHIKLIILLAGVGAVIAAWWAFEIGKFRWPPAIALASLGAAAYFFAKTI